MKSMPDNEIYTRVVLQAESKMEEILSSGEFTVGQTGGSIDDDLAFTVNISEHPNEEEEQINAENKETPMIRIDLTVSWEADGKTKTYTLSTLKSVFKK